jgi:YD repeat-containing protein
LLKRQTDPINNVTEMLYDANLTQVQLTIGAQLAPALRRVVKFSRDEEDQITSETDTLGNITRYGLDAPGNVVSVTDANGNKTDFEFDRNNRLIKETRPSVTDPVTGLPTRYTVLHQYDANFNEVSTTDENGHVTAYAFDKDDRLVMVTDGNGTKIVYSWDSRDNQTQIAIGVDAHFDASSGHVVIDSAAQAAVTSFVYDEFNQLVAATDAVGNALVSSDLQVYQNLRTELGFAAGRRPGPDRQDHSAQPLTEARVRPGRQPHQADRSPRSHYHAGVRRARSRANPRCRGHHGGAPPALRYDGNDNLSRNRRARADHAPDLRRQRPLGRQTDPLGVVTRHEYDHVGNVTADIDAFGTVQARTYSYVMT